MGKWILSGVLVGVLTVGLVAQTTDVKTVQKEETERLKAIQESEKAELKRQWDNLKSFQLELERRAAELDARRKELDEREKAIDQRFENESVTKQVIESYETIDPDQAAPLMLALFKEDESLTALLLRKMTPKKAGKILEAMVPLDRDASTRLSQKILTFYSNRKAQSTPAR